MNMSSFDVLGYFMAVENINARCVQSQSSRANI